MLRACFSRVPYAFCFGRWCYDAFVAHAPACFLAPVGLAFLLLFLVSVCPVLVCLSSAGWLLIKFVSAASAKESSLPFLVHLPSRSLAFHTRRLVCWLSSLFFASVCSDFLSYPQSSLRLTLAFLAYRVLSVSPSSFACFLFACLVLFRSIPFFLS